jgi:hypothetical protein
MKSIGGTVMVQERNIVVCILLSLITCGLYGIYWFICLTNDTAKTSGDINFSGGKAFLFTIITCGIYMFFWYYKMGKNLKVANDQAGINASDNSVLYLVLGLFGLGIVNYCIMQSELNAIARKSSTVA